MRFLLPLVLFFTAASVEAEPGVRVTDFAERLRIMAALELDLKSDDPTRWICETMPSGSVLNAAIAALELAQFGDRQPGSSVVIPRLAMSLLKADAAKLPEITLEINRVEGSLAKYMLHFVLSQSTRVLVSFSYELLPAKSVNTGGILDSKMKLMNVLGEGKQSCWARTK